MSVFTFHKSSTALIAELIGIKRPSVVNKFVINFIRIIVATVTNNCKARFPSPTQLIKGKIVVRQ